MTHTAEILTSSVVVLGNFNPVIFTPDWLEKNGLIGAGDAESAREPNERQSLVITRQVSAFETEWFSLQVLENRMVLTSKGPLSPAIKDLAVGILQIVSHTPVTAVGLNFDGHFKFTADECHKIGDTLAPKNIWNDLYPDESAGLIDLIIKIEANKRDEKPVTKDHKRLQLQQSTKVRPGVFIAYNDHYEIESNIDDRSSSAETVADIVDKKWESTWKDAIDKFDQLLTKSLEK